MYNEGGQWAIPQKKTNSRIFQISVRVGGKFCPSLGELETLVVGVYRVVKTWGGGVILTKNNILWIVTTKHQLKTKLGWPVCQKGGGNWLFVVREYKFGGWIFPGWGGRRKFLTGGGGLPPPFPTVGRTNRKGGLRICILQRYWRNSKWIFRRVSQNNMEFPVVIKKKSWGISRSLGFRP